MWGRGLHESLFPAVVYYQCMADILGFKLNLADIDLKFSTTLFSSLSVSPPPFIFKFTAYFTLANGPRSLSVRCAATKQLVEQAEINSRISLFAPPIGSV